MKGNVLIAKSSFIGKNMDLTGYLKTSVACMWKEMALRLPVQPSFVVSWPFMPKHTSLKNTFCFVLA